METPTDSHWDDALRVVCYLNNCSGQGILLKSGTALTLNSWCDVYWAAWAGSFSLMIFQLLGVVRSRKRFHVLRQRQTIDPWHTHYVR